MTEAPPSGPLSGVGVLQLTQRYPPAVGGVERHVARLAQELARAGARVHVATTDLVRDRPFERARFAAVPGPISVERHRAVRWLPAPHGVGIAAPGMLRDALRVPTSVIHAHAFGYFPTWAGRVSRDLRRIPLIVTPHSHEGAGTRSSRLYASLTARFTLRGAERVVALTRIEADRLVRWGLDPAQVRVIPNGVDLAEFAGRPTPGERTGPPVVLYVGRIYPEQKGLDTLLTAFALLSRTLTADLRLVGEDWGGTASLRRSAADQGLSDRVKFLGKVSRGELLKEYAGAHVLAVPSHFDAFPFVLLEAMAAGLPVVASRVGGIPEVVVEHHTALLVPPGDPGPLAEALARFVSDPSLATRFGGAGRERAGAFSWDRIVPQYLALYSEIIRT